MKPLPEVVVVFGPTGAGKTEKALDIASGANGEIVSVDSLQIYKDMDIGTAKPSPDIRQAIPHHMVDIVAPNVFYDVGDYVRDANQAINEIISRGKVPVLVGGAGFFLEGLLYGSTAAPKSDPEVRNQLQQLVEEKGAHFVYEKLKKVDPVASKNIHPNNVQRVIRALEVFDVTGKKFSSFEKQKGALKFVLKETFHINPERKILYAAIEKRAEGMFKKGLVEEARSLLEKYPSKPRPFSAIGYKEAFLHLGGEISLKMAISLVKMNSRKYAKRQKTWFRHHSLLFLKEN